MAYQVGGGVMNQRGLGQLFHDPKVETFKPEEATLIGENERGQKETTGTTTIAAVYGDGPEDGGVVLCADGRTSMGPFVCNPSANKLTKLTDTIYCCRSGHSADTQMLADHVASYLRRQEITLGHPVPVETAARLFQQFSHANRFNIVAGILVAGWDPVRGGQCYNIHLGGAKVKGDYVASGSGSTYIHTLYDREWKEGMTKDETKQFLLKLCAHAKSRDGHSGGNMRTLIINKDGKYDELHPVGPKTTPYELETDPHKLGTKKLQPEYASTTADMYP